MPTTHPRPQEALPAGTDIGGRGHGIGLTTRVEPQRARILAAMAELACERGFAGCSVEAVIKRAGVSRRTFYEQFDGLKGCFVAVLDLGAETVNDLIERAFAEHESWLDGLRWALASLLVLFDSEPQLARVWLVESMTAGRWALEHREARLAELFLMITQAWPPPASMQPAPLVIEGVFASVRSIVVQRLVTRDAEVEGPLLELLPALMGLIAAPFVSARAQEREIERGEELVRSIAVGELRPVLAPRVGGESGLPPPRIGPAVTDPALPPLLSNPSAHRARRCLLFVAESPGASNTHIAAGIGVEHKAQISQLLAQLSREGLLLKTTHGPGKHNEWQLSTDGKKTAAALRESQARFTSSRPLFLSSNS